MARCREMIPGLRRTCHRYLICTSDKLPDFVVRPVSRNARERMGEFSIGQSVRRREDPRLLRGCGRFFDDLKLADQLYAAIVRSPHAHADIRGIDARGALALPGVRGVLTGEDYQADELGSMPSMAIYKK